MKVSDKAWTAGIIDGEGTICRKVHNGCEYRHISVVNVDPRMLEKLKALWGGYIYIHVKKRGKWKETKCWHLYPQKKVLLFLRKIAPYLIIKKEKAMEAIAFIERKLS